MTGNEWDLLKMQTNCKEGRFSRTCLKIIEENLKKKKTFSIHIPINSRWFTKLVGYIHLY